MNLLFYSEEYSFDKELLFEITSYFQIQMDETYYFATFNVISNIDDFIQTIDEYIESEKKQIINYYKVEESYGNFRIKIYSSFTVCWEVFLSYLNYLNCTDYFQVRALKNHLEQQEREKAIPSYSDFGFESQEEYENYCLLEEFVNSDNFNSVGYTPISYELYMENYD
ncbi:hypothetical protein [Scytonema sp. NUACC26]|uniref:hypothetical protein n=1 Tax=Scytonema sp. NUACC26 TaxID=3140176 RepID=UPI0034DC28C7